MSILIEMIKTNAVSEREYKRNVFSVWSDERFTGNHIVLSE